MLMRSVRGNLRALIQASTAAILSLNLVALHTRAVLTIARSDEISQQSPTLHQDPVLARSLNPKLQTLDPRFCTLDPAHGHKSRLLVRLLFVLLA